MPSCSVERATSIPRSDNMNRSVLYITVHTPYEYKGVGRGARVARRSAGLIVNLRRVRALQTPCGKAQMTIPSRTVLWVTLAHWGPASRPQETARTNVWQARKLQYLETTEQQGTCSTPYCVPVSGGPCRACSAAAEQSPSLPISHQKSWRCDGLTGGRLVWISKTRGTGGLEAGSLAAR